MYIVSETQRTVGKVTDGHVYQEVGAGRLQEAELLAIVQSGVRQGHQSETIP